MAVTGETSDASIDLATLVIVALITPLKEWMQGTAAVVAQAIEEDGDV